MRIEAVKSIKTRSNGLMQYHQLSNDKKILPRETRIDRIPSLWFSKRFFIAVVIFLCIVNMAMVMTNINIAIVEMTSTKSIVMGNHTIVRPAEFQWDPSIVGIVTSILSYGGLFSIGGGFFVRKLGGSVSGAFVSLVCGILTILQPPALRLNFGLFVIFRLLTGFFANCFFVSTAELYSRWFPKKERSTLICFCGNGLNVGVTVVLPLFGYVAERLGWQMVFYISGVISLASSLLCYFVIKNQPTQDKWISEEELSYILDETNEAPPKHINHPYMKILSSPPVWALCFNDFSSFWAQVFISASLPLYVKDMTGKSTDEIGLLSSTPGIISMFLYPLAGTLKDYWRNRTEIDLTRLDKIIIATTFLSMSVLFAVCTIFSNFTLSMIIFITIEIITSMIAPVQQPNIVNIAPNDSSVVAGMTQISSSLSVIVARTVTGYMTMNHTTQEWNNCFLLTSAILIIGAVTFVKYGSSEPQSWSLLPDTKEEYASLIKTNIQA